MMRRLMILATSTTLFLGATQLLAHERFRIVGTITKRTATQIEVKTKENKKIPIDVDKQTIILRDKKKVPATTLKVGLSVVVDAIGDDEADLVAEQVRLVPAIPVPPAKSKPRPPR
jgi:hypothetical protein